jgi:Mg2+ and Co2+ transporter CorA
MSGFVATALLFDRDQVDEVQDWTEHIDDLGRKSILWIDLDRADRAQIEETVDTLDLAAASRERLTDGDTRPYFGDFDSYLHVTAFAPVRRNGQAECVKVDCLVSRHWIVTVHETPIEVFDDFRERMTTSSGDVGQLDGVEFLADMLAWVLEAYLDEFEAIELALEKFDERAMQDETDDAESEVRRLVELRQQIGRLRRALVSHRGMFLALARPELEAVTSSDHGERFQMLRARRAPLPAGRAHRRGPGNELQDRLLRDAMALLGRVRRHRRAPRHRESARLDLAAPHKRSGRRD